MRGKIDGLQSTFDPPTHAQKKKGVFERLWADAGLKEERMHNMKDQINKMIKEELMKKILLHKNRTSKDIIKNTLLLGNFLEQVRLFINKEIYEIEINQNLLNAKDLKLEGHNDGPAISPGKHRS